MTKFKKLSLLLLTAIFCCFPTKAMQKELTQEEEKNLCELQLLVQLKIFY